MLCWGLRLQARYVEHAIFTRFGESCALPTIGNWTGFVARGRAIYIAWHFRRPHFRQCDSGDEWLHFSAQERGRGRPDRLMNVSTKLPLNSWHFQNGPCKKKPLPRHAPSSQGSPSILPSSRAVAHSVPSHWTSQFPCTVWKVTLCHRFIASYSWRTSDNISSIEGVVNRRHLS